jgi:hypothetical protein
MLTVPCKRMQNAAMYLFCGVFWSDRDPRGYLVPAPLAFPLLTDRQTLPARLALVDDMNGQNFSDDTWLVHFRRPMNSNRHILQTW